MQAERKNDGWLGILHPWIIHRPDRRRQAIGPYLLRSGRRGMVYPPAEVVKKEKAGYMRGRGRGRMAFPVGI